VIAQQFGIPTSTVSALLLETKTAKARAKEAPAPRLTRAAQKRTPPIANTADIESHTRTRYERAIAVLAGAFRDSRM
jgi:hypothetical protein